MKRNSIPLYPSLDAIPGDPEQTRLSLLGCDVFIKSPYVNATNVAESTWQRLLPQLVYDSPSARAAAAAFGAAYESSFLSCESTHVPASVIRQYISAIAVVQDEINALPSGSAPLLLSCVLLASTDLLQRRQYDALTHLEGSFQILTLNEKEANPQALVKPTSDSNRLGRTSVGSSSLDEDLVLLLQTVDIQLASYRFTCPPHLTYARTIHLDSPIADFSTHRDALLRLVPLLNSCYRFVAYAAPQKYAHASNQPPNVSLDQGRYIGLLNQWLRVLHTFGPGSSSSLNDRFHQSNTCLAYILYAQCLSTLITLSTITSACESAYDDHAAAFRQIVSDAEIVLEVTHANSSDQNSTRIPFSLGIGIAEPLFLAACKYRDPLRRRRAVELLGRLGREGPWDGKLLAVVARRVIEVEEQDGGVQEAADVRDVGRVHSCMMMEFQSGNVVGVEFGRWRGAVGNNGRGDGIDWWETWTETLSLDTF